MTPDSWGINFVMPEDGFVSMRDYTLHMKMVEYLHAVYPKVHITLHAGELAPGLVPPEGLRFHIRQAVEMGHAERIGHGVDVMYEDDAPALLKEMAREARDGRDQSQLQRWNPGHQGRRASLPALPRGACSGGALHR